MVFSSLIFLFAFLTTTLAVYYLVPLRLRNLVLFVMSLLFYGWKEPKNILLMLVSIVSAYAFGFLIEKYRESNVRKAKCFLFLSLAVNLSFLLFFKYFNFFASIFGAKGIPELTLPVGISFYTFQIMSYSIDLYRGQAALARRVIPFGTYVTLFPQLIAGPIVRYKDICDQLTSRKESVEKFARGVRRFVCGLGKKLLLGDACAALAERLITNSEFSPTALGAFLTAVFYTFHIYYDFSGYSDMAIGLGRMFGFEFPENFNYPYTAKSVTDFWRRWHITLSTWFREYVYIPLGGNRKGKFRTYCNLAIVWLLTGFWHGANWNYLLWGAYFLLFLIIEKAFLLRFLEKSKVLSHLYLLVVVLFGWVLFFGEDLTFVTDTVQRMFFFGAAAYDSVVVYDLLHALPLLILCAVGCTPLPAKYFNRLRERCSVFDLLTPVFTVLLLALCTAYMVDNTFSPFLYYIF